MRLGYEFREVKITKEMFDYYKPTFDIELHDVGKIMYVKYDYKHPQFTTRQTRSVGTQG